MGAGEVEAEQNDRQKQEDELASEVGFLAGIRGGVALPFDGDSRFCVVVGLHRGRLKYPVDVGWTKVMFVGRVISSGMLSEFRS